MRMSKPNFDSLVSLIETRPAGSSGGRYFGDPSSVPPPPCEAALFSDGTPISQCPNYANCKTGATACEGFRMYVQGRIEPVLDASGNRVPPPVKDKPRQGETKADVKLRFRAAVKRYKTATHDYILRSRLFRLRPI